MRSLLVDNWQKAMPEINFISYPPQPLSQYMSFIEIYNYQIFVLVSFGDDC